MFLSMCSMSFGSRIVCPVAFLFFHVSRKRFLAYNVGMHCNECQSDSIRCPHIVHLLPVTELEESFVVFSESKFTIITVVRMLQTTCISPMLTPQELSPLRMLQQRSHFNNCDSFVTLFHTDLNFSSAAGNFPTIPLSIFCHQFFFHILNCIKLTRILFNVIVYEQLADHNIPPTFIILWKHQHLPKEYQL